MAGFAAVFRPADLPSVDAASVSPLRGLIYKSPINWSLKFAFDRRDDDTLF
jgi:hypothetical protein